WAKLTVFRAWLAQWVGQSVSGVRGWPVVAEMTGMVARWWVRPAAVSDRAPRAGSISGEWKAWLTCSQRVRWPWVRSRAAMGSRVVWGRAGRRGVGVLMAATAIWSSR